MMRVKIRISRERDEEINEIVPDFGDSIRLRTWAKFRMRDNNWSKTASAIIDTGAPISVLPYDLWRRLKIKMLATGYSMRGIIPREECKLPVDIGEVYCILLDEEGVKTEETKIRAFLAFSDLIPIVLGFKFLLERLKICFDCEEGHAWLEEKESGKINNTI